MRLRKEHLRQSDPIQELERGITSLQYKKSKNPFSKLYIAICCMIIVGGTILMPVQAVSQSPTITYQFPNGFPNVAVNINCIFSSNFDIDTSHVIRSIFQYPIMEWDSINNTSNYAIAYFIETGSYVSTDSSLINAVVNNGVPAIFKTTSLRNFKVIPFRDLKNNQSYDIMIKYLHVFDGIRWVTVDTIFQNALSTVGEMYRIETSSVLFNNSNLKCSDSIYVTFNKKLSTATINMQDILTLSKVTGTTPIDSLYHITTTQEVETSCYLSEDSMTVHLNVQLEAGELYNLQVHQNLLTGNPNDSISMGFSVSNLAVLTSGVKHVDGEIQLPENLFTSFYGQEFYVAEGNEITLTTPISCENYIFKHWQCETLPNINNSTELLLNIEVDCSMSGNHSIIAVYDNALIDTLTLEDSLFIGGDIVVEGFIDSLGNGQYTFMRQIDNIISIIPIADSGYSFNGWKYDTLLFADLEIVGNSVQISTGKSGMGIMGDINDPNGRNIDLGGGWRGPFTNCTSVTFCIHFFGLSGVNGSVVPNINNIVEVKINGMPHVLTIGNEIRNGYACINLPLPLDEGTLGFEFKFKNDCFYLEKSHIYQKNLPVVFTKIGEFYVYEPNLADISNYRDADCKVTLNISLRRRSAVLEVDKAIIGSANFSYPGKTFDIMVYNTDSQTKKTPKVGPGYPRIWKEENSPSGYIWKIRETYECDCNEELDLFPYLYGDRYEYGYWSAAIPEDPEDYDLTYSPVVSPREVGGIDRNDVLMVNMSENKHVQYRFDANFHVTKFVFWQPKVIEGNDIVKEPVEKHIPYENLITSPDQTINFYEMVAMKFSGLSSYEYLDLPPIKWTLGKEMKRS